MQETLEKKKQSYASTCSPWLSAMFPEPKPTAQPQKEFHQPPRESNQR
jgi:hypothetical protein